MNAKTLFAALGAGGILLLSGCAGGGQSGAGEADRAGGAGGAAREGTGSQGRSVAGGTPARVQPGAGRAVVYTADLRVRAGNVTQAAAEAKRQVSAAGGHVANERAMSEPGAPASVVVTFKIPAERYVHTLDQLSGRLGTRLSLLQNSEDVTEAIADVDSRVRSARSALASFRKLLAEADTIDDVLSVEREIATRQSDLESLQARQRALAEQTRFATVTLRLEPTPIRPHQAAGGFLGGLRSGWSAFIVVSGVLATVAGWLLPFAGAGAAVAIPGWRIWRVIRRRRPPAAPRYRPPDVPPAAPPGASSGAPPGASPGASSAAPPAAPPDASSGAPPGASLGAPPAAEAGTDAEDAARGSAAEESDPPR
jgi:hypothetical protein